VVVEGGAMPTAPLDDPVDGVTVWDGVTV
jgi:hypothetical protein